MPQNPERVLTVLSSARGWTTSAELSDRLGVSDRTVRIHVAAARNVSAPFRVIDSSSRGYRLNKSEYAAYLASHGPADGVSPRQDRLRAMIRALSLDSSGISINRFAEELFVSESTVEADIRKLRTIAVGTGVTVDRKGNVITLSGAWASRRRLLSEVFRADGAVGYLEHQAAEMNTTAARLRGFKSAVIRWIENTGRGVNEYGIASVMLHVAIAVDRADHRTDNASDTAADVWSEQETRLSRLIDETFDVELASEDLHYLSELIDSRATTHSEQGGESPPDAAVLAMTHRILASTCETHAVVVSAPDMERRLARHIESLLNRARSNNATRNPLTQSIKLSHPLIFDVAVDLARQIEAEQHVAIGDDEVSFIALHLGLAVTPTCREKARISAALVCPSYYDMIDVVKQRIESEFGADIAITRLMTRTDAEPHDFDENIVITTFLGSGTADNWVEIHPLLADLDMQAIRSKITAVRKRALNSAAADTLRSLFNPALSIVDLDAATPASAIAQLGDLMIRHGGIDADFVNACLERERRSSTDFTATVAFPHAWNPTVAGTQVAVGMLKSPLAWGGQNVRVVVLAAFGHRGAADPSPRLDDVVDCFRDVDRMKAIVNSLIDNAAMSSSSSVAADVRCSS